MNLTATCSKSNCSAAVHAKGLCVRHYKQSRPTKRARPDRRLANRANQRALTRLAQNHADEFRALFDECLTEVLRENEAARSDLNTTAEIVPLRPGRRPVEHTVIDRVDVIRQVCETCGDYHAAGHQCPECAISKTMPPPSSTTPEQRIRRLLEAGHSAQWIVDQGESRSDVLAVMAAMRRERTHDHAGSVSA